MKTLAVAALAALLFAVPAALAQTTPPATPAPAVRPEPAPIPAVTPPATATNEQAANAMSHSCRTRKAVGEACACRSEPDHVGVVETASDGGRNMCVVRIAPMQQ